MYRQNYDTYLIEILSNILYFEFAREMHLFALEELIANSDFIHALETDDDDYFDNHNKKKIIEDTIGREIKAEDIDVVSDESYWLAHAYYYLFLKYRKSFLALFLIIPINLMIHYFPTLHTVSWSYLYHEYEREASESTLLKRLLKRRMMTMKELSIKTGINFNTIDRYLRSDEYLYNASFANVYKLSKVLDVPSTFFLRKIEFEDDNRNEIVDLDVTLAKFFVAYYYKDVDLDNLIIVTKETNVAEPVSKKKDKVLVYYLFEPESKDDFDKYKDVIIITSKTVYRHSEQVTKIITDKAINKINKNALL